MPSQQTTKLDDDRLWDAREAAHYCNVTPRTVLDWKTKGLLPFLLSKSGHIRFRPDDVKAMYELRLRGDQP